jgi:protein O-mannosyl-transferase
MGKRPREWLAACVLTIIALLAWRNSIESGFVFDNKTLLLEDTRIHKVTPENVALILHHTYWWPNEESGLYRPITTLSYLFNYAILGNADRPAGYHWINLLLHIGNVLLVFALARRLLTDFWPSFLVASVWAVHPVLTESVTNIVGRADLLAGMTVLGGFLMYLRSTEAAGWRRAAWLAGLAAITAVGVFCKESAVTVAGIVALYELIWWNRERLRGFGVDLGLGWLAMAPALLAMWWIRSGILSAAAPTRFPYIDNPIMGAGFWTGRLTAIKVIAKYLGLLVWPAKLSPDYSYAQIPLIDGRLSDWIAWIVVAGVALGVALLFRRNKPAFFAAGFAFIAFLPTSNLVMPIGAIMAERFLYLPAIGFSICLVIALYSICGRLGSRTLAPVLLGLLITTAFGVRTWARNRDWRDGYTLFSAAVQTSPLSFKTHTGLGQALIADHDDLVAAIVENERSLAILDRLPDRLNSTGVYLRTAAQYIWQGSKLIQRDEDGKPHLPPDSALKYERARTLLLRAVSILKAQDEADREKGLPRGDPVTRNLEAEASAYLMLSEADQRLGRTDEALHSALEGREARPIQPFAYERIHDVLLATGRRDEAMAALMQGVLLTSNTPLQQKLMADYGDRPDESQCAISLAEAAPALNFSCGVVRKLACSVSGEVVRLALKAGGREAAMRLKNELAAKHGCGESLPAR